MMTAKKGVKRAPESDGPENHADAWPGMEEAIKNSLTDIGGDQGAATFEQVKNYPGASSSSDRVIGNQTLLREPQQRILRKTASGCVMQKFERKRRKRPRRPIQKMLKRNDSVASDESVTLKLMREQEGFEQKTGPVTTIDISDESQNSPEKMNDAQTWFSSGEEEEASAGD